MEYHFPLQPAIMDYHLHWKEDGTVRASSSDQGEYTIRASSSNQEEHAVRASPSRSLKRPRSPEDTETTTSAAPRPLPTLYNDSQARTRASIIQQIETIFISLSISTAPLQLSLTPRRHTSTFDPSTSTIRRPISTAAPTVVSFPRNTWRFACVLKILDLLHESLVSGRRPITKRDLFYKHPTLFRTQRVVDGLIDDIAATFNVPRDALGVVASAKGMVYGDVVIGGRCFLADGGGVLVPGEVGDVVVGEEVEWVLVVEKEAVFRSLACGGGRKGVVVTGKGYPDVATREVVRLLAEAGKGRRSLEVFALVDMDPHGVEILATYRFGSVAMAWENHRLAVERAEWLGVKSGDLVEAVARSGGDGQVEGVARLTARDRKKAVGMLGKAWMQVVPEWRSELQKMLFLNIKAEIETVSGVGVKEWVEEKIAARMGR